MFKLRNIKSVLSLALPAVGEMILYMMIWVFDTMMVGKYGGNIAVSTVGLSSEIMYTFMNVFIAMGISIAISSLVARKIGANLKEQAEEYATIGFFIGAISAVLISLGIYFFSDNLLKLANATDEVINYGLIFLRICSIGILFSMMMNLLNGMLRGYGNTKIPLLGSALVNIINLSLDWLLIFGHYGFPELGIKGAAIATTTAQISGFMFIALYVYYKSEIKIRLKYIFNICFIKTKEVLVLGIPASLQEASFSFSRLLTVFMIMNLGTISFASNQIATTIESISFMPGWGFAVAATTLCGQKFGEKNIVRVKDFAYTSMLLGIVVMTLCSVLFLVAPNFLIRMFISENEKQVIYLGALCVMIAALEQPFMAVSMILGGVFKGSGDTKTPFFISVVSSWIIRIPLMYYFIYILKTSVVTVWWITAVQWIFETVLLVVLLKKKFKKIETEPF